MSNEILQFDVYKLITSPTIEQYKLLILLRVVFSPCRCQITQFNRWTTALRAETGFVQTQHASPLHVPPLFRFSFHPQFSRRFSARPSSSGAVTSFLSEAEFFAVARSERYCKDAASFVVGSLGMGRGWGDKDGSGRFDLTTSSSG